VTEVEVQPLESSELESLEIPPSLPVLPLKETVVFPDSATPLAIGQERSVALIDDVVARDGMLALVSVKDSEVEQPGWDDLYEVGTAAMVHKLIKVPDGTLRILVQGLERVKLDSRVQDEPYLIGSFSALPDVTSDSKEVEALTRNVQMLFGRIVGLVPYLPAELELAASTSRVLSRISSPPPSG
jgi:ATP-dependent Lon protease